LIGKMVRLEGIGFTSLVNLFRRPAHHFPLKMGGLYYFDGGLREQMNDLLGTSAAARRLRVHPFILRRWDCVDAIIAAKQDGGRGAGEPRPAGSDAARVRIMPKKGARS